MDRLPEHAQPTDRFVACSLRTLAAWPISNCGSRVPHVTRARLERLLQQTGVLLALLCPVAWLYTGWHLAVEAHHDHVVVAHDHHRGHHEDALHHDGAPAEGEGHHHDDHLIPDSLRPEQGQPFAIDLTASDVVLVDWHPDAAAPAVAPFDDIPSATDPPLESLQPRAPPVG